MWPFKKQSDTPETIKKETTNDYPKPKVSTQFICNPDATKKMIEEKEHKTFTASRMRVNISSKLNKDISLYSFLEFNGFFEHTENGDYILGWADSYTDNGKQISGKYILIEKYEIILKGKIQRPNDGNISKNGTFIFNDYFSKEEFGGTFFAIGVDGKILIQKKLKANLGNNGISDDGNNAVCQTWYSKISPEDSNKLFFFDLINQELKWSCEPESGNADSFRFDRENGVLFLDYNDGKCYRYNFDGVFLDSEKWGKDKAENANGYELLVIADGLIESINSSNSDLNQYEEAFSLMKRALEKGVSEYTQSTVHRQFGEIYLKFSETAEAINHFEKALSLNPKIGLKKILNSDYHSTNTPSIF